VSGTERYIRSVEWERERDRKKDWDIGSVYKRERNKEQDVLVWDRVRDEGEIKREREREIEIELASQREFVCSWVWERGRYWELRRIHIKHWIFKGNLGLKLYFLFNVNFKYIEAIYT